MTVSGASHQMISTDGRQPPTTRKTRRSYQARSSSTNGDGNWNLAGRTSPGQPAGVDAHYYANVTDEFYQEVFSRDSLDNHGIQMVSTARRKDFNNAFWNGSQIIYGDGDGTTFRALRRPGNLLPRVHARRPPHLGPRLSGRIWRRNEAFSDMMGSSSEFFAAQKRLDPAARPDWQIGRTSTFPRIPPRHPQHGRSRRGQRP